LTAPGGSVENGSHEECFPPGRAPDHAFRIEPDVDRTCRKIWNGATILPEKIGEKSLP
jgi:hypothetical protein